MSRAGSKNANWKGGRNRGGEGMRYWKVHVPDHPNASKQGYVLEHRLVMERELGRLLERDEIVHHKNGDTLDNRPENLEVMTQSEHARLHDQFKGVRYVKPPADRETRECPTCGGEFEVVGKKQWGRKYCSRHCYWNCGRVGAARLTGEAA